MQTIRKRDGSVVPFDATKITAAIRGAWVEVHGEEDEDKIDEVTGEVILALAGASPEVEYVQDLVELALMRTDFAVARAFITYRNERSKQRESDGKKPDPTALSSYIFTGKYARH